MEENNVFEQQSTTINEDNAYFKQMLDCIPVKFYFTKNAHDLLTKKEDEDSEEEIVGMWKFTFNPKCCI